MQLTDISVWLVWILPLISSLFVPLIGRLSEKARNAFTITISTITVILAFSLIPAVLSGPLNITIPWLPANISAGVYIDPLSVLFASLVAFFGLIIAIYSLGYMKHEQNLTRYYFFLLLFIGSMIGLVVSDNFLQLFIFWEMVGLCSYSLISFWNNRPESVKSGNKVFIMTRIGDISLLAAIGILYATIGTFSFRGAIAAITNGQISEPILVTVAFLVLGGAIAKSAQLPLHTWLYSAMEAPTSVSALLHAATMVKAGIYLVARFILIAAPMITALEGLWLPTVAWIGVLTALLGASMALYTSDIKGVLAYSTVSQLGFMMAALGSSGAAASSSLGWFGSLFHMMSHAFFEGLGFLLAGGIIHALGTRDMRLMGGLRKAMPTTFILAVLMVITTSGLPPFAAFFSKGAVIESIMETGNIFQIVIIFATTMITFAYSLRFIKLVFLGEKSEHLQQLHVHEAPKTMLGPAVALGVLCVIWGFLGPWLGGFLHLEGEFTILGSFVSLETPIFLALLVPVALLIYVTYFKNSQIMAKFRSSSNPLTALLKHGYFFDGFYEGVVFNGLTKLSGGLRVFEEVGLGRFPQMISGFVISAALGVQKYLDVLADQLLNVVARRTLKSASKMEKVPQSSMQHYLAAALLGFILILILIIVTVGV